MREARQHQKLISDVVTVAWEHLSKAQRPIKYLRPLISPGRRATNGKQRPNATRLADQEALRLATVVQRTAGEVFFDCNTSRRICVASDASTVTVHECGEAVPRVSVGNWQVDFVAAIESGHLVPAAPEREAAFEGKRQRGRESRQAAPRLPPTRCRGSSPTLAAQPPRHYAPVIRYALLCNDKSHVVVCSSMLYRTNTTFKPRDGHGDYQGSNLGGSG
jgi:hypothetical protein